MIFSQLKNNFLKFVLRHPLFFNSALDFVMNTKLGRDTYYEKYPKNQFIVTKTSEDIYYLLNSSDDVIGRNTFVEQKSYDSEHLINTLKIIGKKKSILLDVGANIGSIGIYGISKGLFDRCISFEPDPLNFRLLQANVMINGLIKNFELRNEALTNNNIGELDLELSEFNFGDHRVRVNAQKGEQNEENRKIIKVSSNTLDNVLKDFDINEVLLFIDAQGYEGHILAGAKNLIDACVPISTEFWPYGLKRSGGLEMFYEVLATSGYSSMRDLRYPEKKLNFSINEIKKIAFDLGDNHKRFTDLVLYCE